MGRGEIRRGVGGRRMMQLISNEEFDAALHDSAICCQPILSESRVCSAVGVELKIAVF